MPASPPRSAMSSTVPPADATQSSLAALRADLDRLDDAIHDLLM